MSIQPVTLLNAAAATGAGAVLDLSVDPRYVGGPHSFVVNDTFVGTVAIEASFDNGVSWFVLGSYTAPTMITHVGVFSRLRGNVTAYTSGAITVSVLYGRLQDLTALQTDITTLLGRLTATRAGYLDNLLNLDTKVSTVSAKANIDNLIKQLRIGNQIT